MLKQLISNMCMQRERLWSLPKRDALLVHRVLDLEINVVLRRARAVPLFFLQLEFSISSPEQILAASSNHRELVCHSLVCTRARTVLSVDSIELFEVRLGLEPVVALLGAVFQLRLSLPVRRGILVDAESIAQVVRGRARQFHESSFVEFPLNKPVCLGQIALGHIQGLVKRVEVLQVAQGH